MLVYHEQLLEVHHLLPERKEYLLLDELDELLVLVLCLAALDLGGEGAIELHGDVDLLAELFGEVAHRGLFKLKGRVVRRKRRLAPVKGPHDIGDFCVGRLVTLKVATYWIEELAQPTALCEVDGRRVKIPHLYGKVREAPCDLSRLTTTLA